MASSTKRPVVISDTDRQQLDAFAERVREQKQLESKARKLKKENERSLERLLPLFEDTSVIQTKHFFFSPSIGGRTSISYQAVVDEIKSIVDKKTLAKIENIITRKTKEPSNQVIAFTEIPR